MEAGGEDVWAGGQFGLRSKFLGQLGRLKNCVYMEHVQFFSGSLSSIA